MPKARTVEISVVTDYGLREVQAYPVEGGKPLYVHKTLQPRPDKHSPHRARVWEESKWVVTHGATGFAVARFPLKRSAMKFGKHLLKVVKEEHLLSEDPEVAFKGLIAPVHVAHLRAGFFSPLKPKPEDYKEAGLDPEPSDSKE